MADCKYLQDEMCVNDQCPMCADYCPVPNTPGVCKHEERPGCPGECGRWIVRHEGMNNWAECSECGAAGNPHWKLCPECETKMGWIEFIANQ